DLATNNFAENGFFGHGFFPSWINVKSMSEIIASFQPLPRFFFIKRIFIARYTRLQMPLRLTVIPPCLCMSL
ncbi:hypothetical protein, partial [Cronobacter sakazakii]|uniref:hypothetical protein n=1 Tax=Cronobacter sakazakii TaxID=28141 RepID=UPI001F414CE0